MFVDDCAEAIRRVTEHGKIAECYNIGIEFEKANLHLTQMIHQIVGKLMQRGESKPQFAPIPDRPYHDRRYYIDFSKIRNALGK
jgi:dTDP-D-glucose 4,6-dehydratase